MSSQKKQTSFVILAILVLVGAVAFYAFMSMKGEKVYKDEEGNVIVDTLDPAPAPVSPEPETGAMNTPQAAPAEEAPAAKIGANGPYNYPFTNSILGIKALGKEDAPLTIVEFSSLSCGHCGDFHKNAYNDIKRDYIETGKVRFIVVDFPLNLPAVEGAMLAHCLPEDQYFNFIQLLFTTQSDWLVEGDYLSKLKQNAALAGLGEAEIEACLQNQALKDALVKRNEEAQKIYSVEATPTFIFNNSEFKLTGARPYSEFKAKIDEFLAKSE